MNFKNIDYVSKRKVFFTISGFIQIIGIIAILVFGFNLGVDFQGGTRLDVLVGETFAEQDVRAELQTVGLTPGTIETAGNQKERAAVRFTEALSKEQVASAKTALTEKYGEQVDIEESSVDPMMARELVRQAIYAVGLASLGIIIYLTIRFEYRFAVTGVLALLHDAFAVIAVFSIFKIEVDLTFIAAILTIVGYSINDTIVTFDRIRENLPRYKVKGMEDLEKVVNVSIQETIVRSLNTVITVLFASVALLIFGGESIRNFALALTVGLVFGMYSSIFIAAQLWLDWKGKELFKKRPLTNNEAS
ncbi:protein translocase subunit SecF [Ammoniphilus oxalaticus]|uniref:protein translocase subunit SecF n=1 Tax=Ammoniphilus oxalaticus TaxID=66863 RepID=UPI00147649D3|nr:protein translocase subunit SecF [Ammoniphilus oxalaticus]